MSDFPESAGSVLSVLPLVIVISSGILRLPMAMMIDKIPRNYGFLLAWSLFQISLFIIVVAPSLAGTVVGYILYGIGSSGMDFVLTVILADMTSLKNRGMISPLRTLHKFSTTSTFCPSDGREKKQKHDR